MIHHKTDKQEAALSQESPVKKIPILNAFSDSSEFQFNCSDISRLRHEIKVLIQRLSFIYLSRKNNEVIMFDAFSDDETLDPFVAGTTDATKDCTGAASDGACHHAV